MKKVWRGCEIYGNDLSNYYDCCNEKVQVLALYCTEDTETPKLLLHGRKKNLTAVTVGSIIECNRISTLGAM